MGITSKMVGAAAKGLSNAVAKPSFSDWLSPKNGTLHVLVVKTKAYIDSGIQSFNVDRYETRDLENVIQSMQRVGYEIVDIKPGFSDKDYYTYLITYK